MKWIKAYDDVPSISRYYVIRNWITGKDGATIYCGSKDSILNYCKEHNLDFPEMEWLDESGLDEKIITVTLFDGLNNWTNDTDRMTISRKDFFDIAKKVSKEIKLLYS